MQEAISSLSHPGLAWPFDLQRARQERGLTQEALAERLGVTSRTISNWERDGRVPQSRRRALERALMDAQPDCLSAIETRQLVHELLRRLEAAGLQ